VGKGAGDGNPKEIVLKMKDRVPVLMLITVLFFVFVISCDDDDDAVDDDAADDDASDDDAVGDDDTIDDDTTDDDTTDDDTTGDDDTIGDDDTTDDDTGDDDTTPIYADEFKLVEIASGTPATVTLAVQACAGLYNRELGGSVYTLMSDKDSRWLEELELEPSATVAAEPFLETCLTDFPQCVRYSYENQQRLLPNILTVGAVLGAVPLDENLTVVCPSVAFDARTEFAERDTPYLATKFVYENYVAETTGLAMLNPGYDTNDPQVWDPALNRDMNPSLIDYVFARKLFVVFLVNGCIDPNPESELLTEIATANPWPQPIGVYGYNNSWLVFGGYFFEAQTRCLDLRNMGAIPTETTNLSFFSTRRAPIDEPGELEQNELENIQYDPDNTYVAFVIGDGDNIAFMMDARGEWINQRLDDCRQPVNSCAPITWSISPHLAYIAPDVLAWYYDVGRETGKDYFMLPPSGHLYAYPASLTEEMQEAFVAATQQDARILGTHSSVHWEWWSTWHSAEADLMPQYAGEDGAIQGLFPVNVPYMLPTFTWWNPDQFFKAIAGEDGGAVVLFRPREWRGIDDSGSGLTEPFYLSPENMAAELSDYPPGTVAYVYMTSDGGLNLENSFMALVQLLPERVIPVSADTAARLALEAVRSGAE